MQLPLLQPILCLSFNPLSQQSGTSPHKAKSLTTAGDACRYGVLLVSLSLSLIWVFLFSPSLKPSRGPSFCFHSHLSPLAVPLIGVTTTGGRGSSSLILYFLSLLFFFFNFYLPFRQDRNPFDTHFVSFSY